MVIMVVSVKKRFLTDADLLSLGGGGTDLTSYYTKADFVAGLGIIFDLQDGKLIIGVNPDTMPEGRSAYELWLDAGNDGTVSDFLDSLKGDTGAAGASAYQLWLAAGNTGSVDQFIASLKGADGKSAYTLWQEAGNTGSVSDFIAALKGAAGTAGADGQSAYEIWQDLSTANTGDEEDFIASLKGADGDPGTNGLSAYEVWTSLGNTGTQQQFINSLKGADGAAGTNGNDGADGLSAYEIWKSLGNTGTEQQFIDSLKGVDGTNGEDGTDGLSAYEIWLELGNVGTEQDFIDSLKGEAGEGGTGGTSVETMTETETREALRDTRWLTNFITINYAAEIIYRVLMKWDDTIGHQILYHKWVEGVGWTEEWYVTPYIQLLSNSHSTDITTVYTLGDNFFSDTDDAAWSPTLFASTGYLSIQNNGYQMTLPGMQFSTGSGDTSSLLYAVQNNGDYTEVRDLGDVSYNAPIPDRVAHVLAAIGTEGLANLVTIGTVGAVGGSGITEVDNWAWYSVLRAPTPSSSSQAPSLQGPSL
jgi:hypothetical protein